MKIFFVLVSVLFLTASCNNRTIIKAERDGEPSIYSTPSDDNEMNEAIAKAKATLNQFDDAFLSKKAEASNFALKVRFPTELGAEHIWATNIQIENGVYYGIVDNLPNSATQVKLGEKVKFKKADVTDWMYTNTGILHGGYTIRLIRCRMNEQEKKQFDTGFPFKIEN